MLLGVRKSLLLRIALPVIALVIALGVMLDRFVLSAVSDHIKTEIQRDLGSLSRRISNICNINFENLLMAGQADNPEALIIKQALTLGQVEDFLVQESLMGIVYDKNLKEILLTTTLPSEPEKWVDSEHEIAGLKKVPGINDKGWFAYYGEFSPWDWQIIVLKNEKEYAALKTKVNRVHQNTLIILFFASILLIFFIYKTIKKPINTIIHPVKKGENPNYRGIDAFEFLSDSIAGMMDALKQSEEKYRSIVETTTGFVWEVDKKGNYTFASATIKDILGYEPEEVLGKSPFFFMPKEEADRVFPIFREKILDLKPFEGVVNKNLHKQGTIIFLETTGVPVFSRDGNRLGYRGINKDITRQLNAEEELKELERHRQQIQKLEAIGTLAAGLAHDFNNLLAVILGNISLSKMEVKKDAHIIKFLNEAEAASIRAGGLANQLITFSKGGMPIKTIGSIKDLLVSSTNTILQEGAVKPVFNLEKDLFMVEYDQAQMKQAFENIITNAVESMSHVGSITINAQNFEPEKNKEKVALPLSRKKYIKITIKDQGRGIDEQNLERIFDPYFTTKEMGSKKGSGLGLTTAYSVIARHDGRIAVNSEPGNGTRFALYIPAYEKQIQQPEKVEICTATKPMVNTGKILLMDDEEMIRTLANRTLTKLGYRPEMSKDGAQALELYQKAMADGNPFDLVILDLTVKDGMGGKDCIKKLLVIHPDVKAIVSSGYSTDPAMIDFKKYGFKLALPKPYDKNEIEDAIKKVLESNK